MFYLSLSVLTYINIYCCYFEKENPKRKVLLLLVEGKGKKVRIMGKLNEL